jgi:predicted ATP-grasp superfamily ATP-dependent carboligase
MASHTRIRQSPRHFGTTSYGEIPARSADFPEERLFRLTEKLLSNFNYHGIFGIEWIEDKKTKNLYLLDFNARPFLSIGHLSNCGLNLPFLSYKELLMADIDDVPYQPRLKHKYWIYLIHDLKTLPERLKDGELSLFDWFKSITKSRSFACWRWSDCLPGLSLLVRYFKSILVYYFKNQ